MKTSGWSKLAVAMIALVALMPGKVRAVTKPFMITDEDVFPHRYARFRDLSLISTGMYVQKCISGPNGTFDYAPPTNFGWSSNPNGPSLTNYLPPECAEYQVGTCVMGDDDSGYGYSQKPGSVSGDIGSSDTTRRGWLRCFSGLHITNSAYYGDTIGDNVKRGLDNFDEAGSWDHDVVASNVNPAYVIPFLQVPGVVGGVTVTGRVDASSSGGNNQLESGWIRLRWRYAGQGTWVATNLTINANGTFQFSPSVDGQTTIVVQAYVPTASPRKDLPISGEYSVVVVPEPASVMMAVGVAWITVVQLTRKRCRGRAAGNRVAVGE